MSAVQIELPQRCSPVVVAAAAAAHHPHQPRSLPAYLPLSNIVARSNARKRSLFSVAAANQRSMLSDTSASAVSSTAAAIRRESLKLSFNRSISEPHAPGVAGVPVGNAGNGINPPVLSPPSASPSLHPSKRCRMQAAAAAEQARLQQQKALTPTIMAPPAAVPSSPLTPLAAPVPPASAGGPFLRPPPPSMSITPAGSVSLPASPCSESSTLQRTLLMQHARTVDHNRLAARLELRNSNSPVARNNGSNTSAPSAGSLGSNFLIVDCRPFITYNVNHIRGAINVNCCDRFNRKRLQQGKATLADLATTKEGKELLKRRTWKEVVVYDDCSDSLENLAVSHTLFLVMNALVEDHREPVMLLGGLRDFQVAHRSLIANHLMQNGPDHHHSQHAPALPSPLLCTPSSLRSSDPSSPSSFVPSTLGKEPKCDIENFPASQVLPYLYLGNMRDAADSGVLKRLGVKYVLNVTAKPPNYRFEPDIVYKQLEAADNGIQNLRQFFEEAFAFIDLARRDRSGVLIHCHAGVSRSPTIAVAYLMKRYPMAMSEAYRFVKNRRAIISPNLNFMGQLYEFEQGLATEKAEAEARRQRRKKQKQQGNSVEDGVEEDDDEEELSVEMREVKESLSSAEESVMLPPSTWGANAATAATPSAGSSSSTSTPFRWAEHQAKEQESVTTGCGV